jgi:hypothetical protein
MQGKAIPILETSFFHQFAYGGQVLVFVEMPNKFIERHYYPVTDDARIKIYDPNNKEGLKNPEIKGYHRDMESDNKHLMFKYRWGQPFATPIFSDEVLQNPIATDEHLKKSFDLGIEWQKILDKGKVKSENPMQIILILLLIVGVICLINLGFSNGIAEKLGVKLFGGS